MTSVENMYSEIIRSQRCKMCKSMNTETTDTGRKCKSCGYTWSDKK